MGTPSTFQPLEGKQLNRLWDALRGNAEENGNLALLVDKKDTSFAGVSRDVPDDEEVIFAIRSVPVHY